MTVITTATEDNINVKLTARKQVKFCGFTQRDDVKNAISLGVDAIGLVFYPPSPRYVTSQQAHHIIQGLSAFTSVVALVVNIRADELQKIAKTVSFDIIQFHGDESAEECRVLARSVNKRWIKALRINAEQDTQESITNTVAVFEQAGASSIIFDAYHKDFYGGTGECFNWSLIPKNCNVPIFLAGGLTPENIQHTLDLDVAGVDVSGGIESQKGIKDVNKMACFLQKFREHL